MQRCRQLAATVATIAGAALTLAACDIDDGRDMQAPPSTETVETAPPTTASPATTPIVVASTGVADETLTLGSGALAAPTLPGEEVAAGSAAIATAAPLPDVSLTGSLRVVAPWGNGGAIATAFTCDGPGTAPIINLRAPDGVTELAVTIVDDGGMVALVVTGIAPATQRLDLAALPPGATVQVNSRGQRAFDPLCPDPGATRTYTTTVYALARPVEIAETDSVIEIFAELDAAALTTSAVVGTYVRPAA